MCYPGGRVGQAGVVIFDFWPGVFVKTPQQTPDDMFCQSLPKKSDFNLFNK